MSRFLAEAQSTQRNLQVFVGATLVANFSRYSRLKSLLVSLSDKWLATTLSHEASQAVSLRSTRCCYVDYAPGFSFIFLN